jgi:site-specific DNA recombinase
LRVAVYIRVSTEEQATEGYSISAQREKLKAYCIAQDWDVVGFYVDEGISAKDMNRPQLQQMIKDIEDGKIDCVLVYRLDRLTRSVLDLYKLLNIFEKHNCKFKSATEVYDTTTAIGRLFITLVAALAQWERENMGERIRLGLQEKVRQGKYAHNQRPFGYNLDLETGTLTINEEEAKVVRLIVDLYLKKGYGANRICKYLNERNITTRDGNAWNDKPLMQLLKNPLYAGTIRWGKEYENTLYVENAVPAIIDKETFEEIQKTIEKRRGLSPKQVSSEYIFSGVFKCNQCGHSMVGYKVYYKNVKGERISYKNYRCFRKKTGECKGMRTVSELALEKSFLSYLKNLDFSLVIDEVAASGTEVINNAEDVEDIGTLKKELEKIEKRKKKWQYAWANELVSDEDFRDRMNEERELEEQIKKQLEAIEVPQEIQTDNMELYSILQDMERNWSKLSDLEKKSLVQMIVKQIHVAFNEKNEVYIEHVDFY